MSTEPDVPNALFSEHDGTFVPSEFTRGPWRPDAQHGGPPSALLGHVIGPEVDDGEYVPHIEVELVRPVPLTPLRGVVRRERVSGRVSRLHAELHSETETVARANALVLARAAFDPPEWEPENTPAIDPPDADQEVEPPRWAGGRLTTYHRNAVQHRFTEGTFKEAGPATDWIRLRQPLVEGLETAPLERVLAAADFGSGVSAVYGPDSPFGLINANLTVALHRLPVGEWISLDARTHADPESGVGVAITQLGDGHGAIGVATQSLLGIRM